MHEETFHNVAEGGRPQEERKQMIVEAILQESSNKNIPAGAVNVPDENLGSELSGISGEIPEEVIEFHLSGSYLTTYERDYKGGVRVGHAPR